MNYEWEIENVGLDESDFIGIQQIICQKIANVIFKIENENCTI